VPFTFSQKAKDGYNEKKQQQLKNNQTYSEELNSDEINHPSKTYEKFNGSYAQDEAHFSDQDLDDVFDGDPDLYWNID
jgi:hypothetical protein